MIGTVTKEPYMQGSTVANVDNVGAKRLMVRK